MAYWSLAILVLGLISCQEEFAETGPTGDTAVIQATSPAAMLIRQIASRDGSFDNIVDGASCFDIQFPYSVSVNGMELSINGEEDLHLVEELFDTVVDDENAVQIGFPITIITMEHTELAVSGAEDFSELAKACKEGGDDDDNECVDFIYPITLFTFDVALERTGSLVAESDRDLRLFFNGLEANDLVSVAFPISLSLYDGTLIQINSNEELIRTVEGARDACDEDDDDDYGDDDFLEDSFAGELIACVWQITAFIGEDDGRADRYMNYSLDFKGDGSLLVGFGGAATLTGNWTSTFGDDGAKVSLDVETVQDFDFDWTVYDLGNGRIQLYNGQANNILMQRTCALVLQELNPEILSQILAECSWTIEELEAPEGEPTRLFGYELRFLSENGLALSNGINTIAGTWEINFDADRELVLAMRLEGEPSLSLDWTLDEILSGALHFEAGAAGSGLALERICDTGNTDVGVLEIRNGMLDGRWAVAAFTQGDGDDTETYSGYTLDFMTDNQVSVSRAGNVFGRALWRVLRDSDGQLKV